MFAPEQTRLDQYVPPSTSHGEVTMARMTNQWKTSSNYITPRDPSVPFEFTPGSTAHGLRRLAPTPSLAPTPTGAAKVVWPPPLPALQTVTVGRTAPYEGAHLEWRPITAGLGGIDPKM
jgi:hypothetical protein